MRNTTRNTEQLVEVDNPDGNGEHYIKLSLDWEYQTNPCDKEPAHYHGEDDGWILLNAKVIES